MYSIISLLLRPKVADFGYDKQSSAQSQRQVFAYLITPESLLWFFFAHTFPSNISSLLKIQTLQNWEFLI